MKLTRRTKLTDELTEYICKYLKTGCFVKTVCHYCNLSPDTFYRWQKQGEKLAGEENLNKNEKQYVKFSDAIRAAQSESVVRHIMIINNAAQKDWRAAAWFLERAYPALYGPHEKLQIVEDKQKLEERDEAIRKNMKETLGKMAEEHKLKMANEAEEEDDDDDED